MTNLNKFDDFFWEQKYKSNQTGWDLGTVSPPLKAYIDQIQDKCFKILIPGGGNNYEAEYLWQLGFKNVWIIDIAKTPLLNFKQRVPDFPHQQIIHSDFFHLNDTFDLIIEQTFFCALDPILRSAYVKKMKALLSNNGTLIGLFFNFELSEEGPPFGGSLQEYKSLFSKHFHLKLLEPAYNSVKPRHNKELFFIFEQTS